VHLACEGERKVKSRRQLASASLVTEPA
jgi:hypothetical protein